MTVADALRELIAATDAMDHAQQHGLPTAELTVRLREAWEGARDASSVPMPEFDHSIGADRYGVARGAYWWHITIGDSPTRHGKFHTESAAQDFALKLLTAFRDGAWTQRKAIASAT